MKYKIKQIYIENFKLIKNGILIDDFNNKDFIILDGPNGYGKTTIFDVIEIALSGKIHRLALNNIVHGNQGADDIVYLNDQNSVMKIVIEFVSKFDSKIIYVYGEPGANLGKSARRIDNYNYFKRFVLDSFNDHIKNIDQLNSISQVQIDQWFNSPNRFYNLYHYIQQEDSTFFLKMKENTRMDTLGKLFDTEKEEHQFSKIKNIHQELKNQISILTEKRDNNNKEISNIQLLNKEKTEYNLEYEEIFKFLLYPPEWDNEILNGLNDLNDENLSKRELYKNEIISLTNFIKDFHENYLYFLQYNTNKEIDLKIENTENLNTILLIYNFIEDLDEINSEVKKNNRLYTLLEDLKKENLLKKIEKIDFNKLTDDINYLYAEVFFDNVNAIISLKEKEKNVDEILRDFIDTRVKIISLFDSITDNKDIDIDNTECPLCGNYWQGGYTQLLAEFKEKGDKIEKLKSSTSLEIEKKYEEFYNEFVNDLNNTIKEYLSKPENIIDSKYFEEISIDSQKMIEVKKTLEWIENQLIDLDELIYKNIDVYPSDIDERRGRLINLLNSEKKFISEDYDHIAFKYNYSNFLEEYTPNIDNLSVEKLKTKMAYIDQQYFQGNSASIIELQTQNKFIEDEQLTKLTEIEKKTHKLLDIYNKNIKDHRKQIGKNIELPFFIFSSKILQSLEYGIGLFIKWNQTSTDILKFTQGNKTSHDALYSMSSGQLSALVISFTLAMNKVFDKSNFGILLIDDPTQTMDEINMSSFIELLRNEFEDKQIILSTHEDEISYFMRFKFSEFNLRTTSINMKDKQFTISQDTL
ncbi:DNA replication and repair protein RecF [Mariniflexile rhizosphaerae]|uniref:AAA family ATPase n=1 Tax=unclassified Mariniflexile TaxID=2643887 RepID=UPI000E336E18|nr:AAA family ATPase [Mariniflexile sp. TRM1-10]AXP79764.1 DNA replication and repair protein RecF [Mariniflexile sp. TRM1-10]